MPAHHCRQKQGLAQPLKQKANEDSATTVKYEALAFEGRGSFMAARKQVQFVWLPAVLLPQKARHLPTNTPMA
jgi:hypothetical protein